jgi:hypothetical protein
MKDPPSPTGTLAVILFTVGSVLLVLCIILALLWLQKRRRETRKREATMMAGNEFLPAGSSGKRGAYAQLEEEWSADMEDGKVGERGMGERGVGVYEQVCSVKYRKKVVEAKLIACSSRHDKQAHTDNAESWAAGFSRSCFGVGGRVRGWEWNGIDFSE